MIEAITFAKPGAISTKFVYHSDTTQRSVAIFSPDERYRYFLMRTWASDRKAIAYCMLNPSTADAFRNDPTVERCQRRALHLGYGTMIIVNAFAWRSTKPEVLKTLVNPIGPMNDAAIIDASNIADMVVCGWGRHASLLNRGSVVHQLLLNSRANAVALGFNSDGSPQHPLYIGYSVQPKPMPSLAAN